jgi:hypothetical protein
MRPAGGEESRSYTPTPRFQETLRFAQSDNPEPHPDSDHCHSFASLRVTIQGKEWGHIFICHLLETQGEKVSGLGIWHSLKGGDDILLQ